MPDGQTPQPGPEPPSHDDAWSARVSRGVQQGDRAALAEFYSAWFDRSLAMARRATGRDESFCLDVVQEAMIKAVSSLRRVQTEAQLIAWMRRTILSCAIDRFRKESARQRRERSQTSGDAAPLNTDTAERLAWLQAELSKTSEEERALIRHRLINGATLSQAGDAIGVSGPAAHGRIRRLLDALRRAGKARFGDA